jgi:N-acetylneuraminic acid mutarotase
MSISIVLIVVLPFMTIIGLINYFEVYSPNQFEAVDALMSEYSWTRGTSIPSPGTEASGIILDNKIYIIGGDDSDEKVTNVVRVYDLDTDGAFNNVEKYNPGTNDWTTEEPMPTARFGSEAVALDNKIFVIGGKTNVGPYVTELNEIFHINANNSRS